VRRRSVRTPDERLVWLLLLGHDPGRAGRLALEHALRSALGRPVPAAIFLALTAWCCTPPSGCGGPGRWPRLPRRAGGAYRADPAAPHPGDRHAGPAAPTQVIDLADRRTGGWPRVGAGGGADRGDQITALLPGISRSGITIFGGLAARAAP